MSSTTNNTPSITAAAAPKLQTLNYVNVLSYLANFLVVFGADRIAGLPDNATLSDKYQTLVTPAPYAFAIWGIIFTSELVWVIAQTHPKFRSHQLVIKGVGYNFCLASLAQCLWTIVFGLEKMNLSLVAMVSILVPLVAILKRMSSPELNASTKAQYWLLKFPFEIHAAWIMAATAVNVNVVFVAAKASPKVQLMVAVLSLVILSLVGFFAVWRKKANNNYSKQPRIWTITCVLAWALLAIAKELSAPRDQIVANFSETAIHRVKIACEMIGLSLLLVMTLEIAKEIAPGFVDRNSDATNESNSNNNSNDENTYTPLNN